jgi:hypothetical protein
MLCVFFLFHCSGIGAEPERKAMPWDTSNLVEGKGNKRTASAKPRAFVDYLHVGAWVNDPLDGFAGEFGWDLEHKGDAQTQAGLA